MEKVVEYLVYKDYHLNECKAELVVCSSTQLPNIRLNAFADSLTLQNGYQSRWYLSCEQCSDQVLAISLTCVRSLMAADYLGCTQNSVFPEYVANAGSTIG